MGPWLVKAARPFHGLSDDFARSVRWQASECFCMSNARAIRVPRVKGSTRDSKSYGKSGSQVRIAGRPTPGRRMRPVRGDSSSSSIPFAVVIRDRPQARLTAAADPGMSTTLRSLVLLDVLSSTPAGPLIARLASMPVCAASLRKPVRNAGCSISPPHY
jgi:hypothetical protein